MQVNNFNSFNLLNQNQPGKYMPGQRLFVEIVSKKPSGEGIIVLDGKEIPALMEISAKAGDKIWVKIQEITDNGLLLVREQKQNPLEISNTNIEDKAQVILLERGLPKDANINKILNDFIYNKQKYELFLQKLSQEGISGLTQDQRQTIETVLQAIPQWSDFSGEKSVKQILDFFKVLGIDYEARLKEIMKLAGENKSNRLQELLSTLKPLLINYLHNHKGALSPEYLNYLEEILNQLTGQQLWLRTGDQENAFVLLNIPLRENDHLFSAKVAIESSRKRNIMDIEHCHLALQMETKVLGEVGVDLWFYENNLSLRLLTIQPDLMVPLVEQILPITKERFSKIGFNLVAVDIENIHNDQEFTSFISGKRKKGVDLII
jgi:hypothetical protein